MFILEAERTSPAQQHFSSVGHWILGYYLRCPRTERLHISTLQVCFGRPDLIFKIFTLNIAETNILAHMNDSDNLLAIFRPRLMSLWKCFSLSRFHLGENLSYLALTWALLLLLASKNQKQKKTEKKKSPTLSCINLF